MICLCLIGFLKGKRAVLGRVVKIYMFCFEDIRQEPKVKITKVSYEIAHMD